MFRTGRCCSIQIRFPVRISVWLSGILNEAFHKISQIPRKFLFQIHQDRSLLRNYLLVIYDNRFFSVLLDDTAILLTVVASVMDA